MHFQSPQIPCPSSPFTPPATGETKVAQQINGLVRPRHTESPPQALKRKRSASPELSLPARQRTSDVPAPILDYHRNPFIQGGPADAGLSGPTKHLAQHRIAVLPPREAGKMTYVFRGQRVTYADPYASDSEEEEEPVMNPCGNLDRFEPRLLFPEAHTSNRALSAEHRVDQFGSLQGPSARHSPRSKHNILAQENENLPVSCPNLALAVEQDELRQQAAMCVTNKRLLARLDCTGWDSEEEDEYMSTAEPIAAPSLSLDYASNNCSHSEQEDNPFLDRSYQEHSMNFKAPIRAYTQPSKSLFAPLVQQQTSESRSYHHPHPPVPNYNTTITFP